MADVDACSSQGRFRVIWLWNRQGEDRVCGHQTGADVLAGFDVGDQFFPGVDFVDEFRVVFFL